MNKALSLLTACLVAAAPAFAQDAKKEPAEKKPPPSPCEKCVNDALRQLLLCEAATKKAEKREACLQAYDEAAKSCSDGACKPAK